jgi:hypothetical protein
MKALAQLTQRTVRKRALALMFAVSLALAGGAAMVASVPVEADRPFFTGPVRFNCLVGNNLDTLVQGVPGRAVPQFREQGYTCIPSPAFPHQQRL